MAHDKFRSPCARQGMRAGIACLAALLALSIPLAPPALAFDPPVDVAGPLKVRIEGPAEVTKTEEPIPLRVVIENRGNATVLGTLEARVIDRWRVAPAQPVSFVIQPGEIATLPFVAVAGEGTINAHYPIHAVAAFEAGGRRHQAHPILIVTTRLLNPPRAERAIPWETVAVAPDSLRLLTRFPVHRARISVVGAPPRTMPVGWQGTDDATGAAADLDARARRGVERDALALLPPSAEGRAGAISVEFPLRLPPVRHVLLRTAIAVRDPDTGPGAAPGDGVTFRVRAVPFDAPEDQAGEVLFERHTDIKIWQDVEVDLSRWAGRALRLQLESDPGPERNAVGDLSFWAAPTLATGAPPAPGPLPDPTRNRAFRRLGTLASGGDRYDVLLFPGRRGLFDTPVAFANRDVRLFFRGFRARAAGLALDDAAGAPDPLLEAKEEPAGPAYRVRHRIESRMGAFDLMGELRVEDAALRARFWLENTPKARPWIAVALEDVAAGPWSDRASRVYAGPGNVLQDPQAFRLDFDGRRLSTSFVGLDFRGGLSLVQGVDAPPEHFEADPDRRRYTLHTPHAQVLTFIPARTVWDGVRAWHDADGLRAGRGVPRLAGRFVFDLSGGRYAETADALARAFRYGLTDAVVVWHDWQRWGRDYRLPDTLPPDPRLGTPEEFAELARACKRRDVLFAPHDNYVDVYPDAEGFSYDQIAFTKDREPVRGRRNTARQAQSYRWRPDRFRPFAERNVRLLREAFAPTACFLDAWGSGAPYDAWTFDGRFIDRGATRNAWADACAWIRDTLGDDAPQISESGHDQLIGWLDGAEADHLRVGDPPAGGDASTVWPIRCADAEIVPWFDAAHHDRFVLLGAGREPRDAPGLDPRPRDDDDDALATEALTGRPPLAHAAFGRDVVRAYWLLHDAMRALALRRIARVEFDGGNLHRQRVRWDNGAEAWVNRGNDDWTVEGHALPQYGFYVRAPAPTALGQAPHTNQEPETTNQKPQTRNQEVFVEAAVERREGVIVEWSRSPSLVYVNARTPGARGAQAGRPAVPRPDRAARMNLKGKAVSFKAAVADGACRLAREGQGLLVTPLPESARFTIRVRWEALPWALPMPSLAHAVDEEGKVARDVPVGRDGGDVVLTCEPGVFAYKLFAPR